MEDELSNALCKDCYTLVEDLIEFSDRVNRVQTLFTRLHQAGPLASHKYDDIRRDCGLLAVDWKHITSRNEPEEAPVDETEADTSDYIVDDMVECFDEDAEIMADIETAEVVSNEENAFETFVEHEESTEETYVKDEEISDEIPTIQDPKSATELVDNDETITENDEDKGRTQQKLMI